MISRSPDETFALGKSFGEKARAGQIYCLDGDLGAGKTVFAQGFAEGLGVSETVNSPTFTIINIYESGRLPLYHFDLYRIEEPEEMEEIGYEEYFYSEGVCLVEWASLVPEIIPETAVRIAIGRTGDGSDTRRITVEDADNTNESR